MILGVAKEKRKFPPLSKRDQGVCGLLRLLITEIIPSSPWTRWTLRHLFRERIFKRVTLSLPSHLANITARLSLLPSSSLSPWHDASILAAFAGRGESAGAGGTAQNRRLRCNIVAAAFSPPHCCRRFGLFCRFCWCYCSSRIRRHPSHAILHS